MQTTQQRENRLAYIQEELGMEALEEGLETLNHEFITQMIKPGSNVLYVKELSREEAEDIMGPYIAFLDCELIGVEVLVEYHMFFKWDTQVKMIQQRRVKL